MKWLHQTALGCNYYKQGTTRLTKELSPEKSPHSDIFTSSRSGRSSRLKVVISHFAASNENRRLWSCSVATIRWVLQWFLVGRITTALRSRSTATQFSFVKQRGFERRVTEQIKFRGEADRQAVGEELRWLSSQPHDSVRRCTIAAALSFYHWQH